MSCGVLSKLKAAQQDVGREESLGVEPGQGALLAQESAHHEPGADEKDHRQRDLGDEQQVAAAAAAAARSASAFLEHLVQVRRARPAARASARTAGSRIEMASAKPSTRASTGVPQQFREVARHDQREQARAPERQRQAEAAAGDRQQHVLGEELLQQPSAARARGGAQRHLLRRTVPAARSRFATFAQAMSSTKLTAPSRNVRPFVAPPKNASCSDTTRAAACASRRALRAPGGSPSLRPAPPQSTHPA